MENNELWTEVEDFDRVIQVLDSSLSLIKWRLKASSKIRLHTDVLALCSGMRPVVMVDYGGKLPELQDRLCALLKLSQKESCIFEYIRVMIIEDMIYLVHVRELAVHIQSSLNSESPLYFIDLEQDPPGMVTELEKTSLGKQFMSVQKHFSPFFPMEITGNNPSSSSSSSSSSCHSTDRTVDGKSLSHKLRDSQSSELINLSSCLQDTEVTVPTLNGWLLGYPVVYAFGKEHIADAIYNLSTKPLHIFKMSISRNSSSSTRPPVEELLSFTVPYDLSIGGSNEDWAKAYLSRMQLKWQRSKQAWRCLTMEVTQCHPLAIVL